MKNTKIYMGLIMMVILLASVMGAGEVVQETDKINYYDAETHTIVITNNGALTSDFNATLPSGWTWNSGSGCTESSGDITCASVASGATVSYTMNSSASDAEYLWTPQAITSTNGYTGNDVNFLRIRDDEIFNTLVEYGRGRGNYFYNSMGTTTSAGMGTGYPYVPNATDFELNFLHKVFNIKQYFDNADAVATDVRFTCTYPEHTIVRQHLTSTISRDGTDWTANYQISEIGGSWERMGFIGEKFDAGEYDVDNNFTISCNNIQYVLSDLGGNITVANDEFTMTIVDIEPLSVVATSGTATIGNGTSEVAISYVFTNDERYPLDDVRLQIQAPPNAVFIGTRGELWGYGEEMYQYALVDLQPGESTEVVLIARFDTSGDTDTTLELTRGIKAEFIPTWEVNSYNPLELMQTLSPATTISVNYGTPATITNIVTLLEAMNATIISTNNIVTDINNTVTTIESYVIDINGTVTSIYTVVTDVQTTVNGIDTKVDNIYTDTQSIVESLNCDTVSDTPICAYILEVNSTITTMQTTINNINSTNNDIYDLNVVMNTTLNSIYTDTQNIYTDTQALIESLNCDTVSDTPICAYLLEVNQTITDVETDIANMQVDVTNIENIITYLNGTVWDGLTAQDIIDQLNASIQSTITDTTEITNKLNSMQEFNEELVFLVTDAVGMATSSKTSLDNGDIETSITSLKTAQKNLEQAARLLETSKADTRVELDTMDMSVLQKLGYFIEKWFKNIF